MYQQFFLSTDILFILKNKPNLLLSSAAILQDNIVGLDCFLYHDVFQIFFSILYIHPYVSSSHKHTVN